MMASKIVLNCGGRNVKFATRTLLRCQPTTGSLLAGIRPPNNAARMTTESKATIQILEEERFVTRRRFSEQDVKKYSEITMDRNPIHLDTEFARKLGFEQPVVHWTLIYGALTGCCQEYFTQKGALVIPLHYFVEHPEPLFVGEEIDIEMTVVAKKGNRLTLTCTSVEPISGRIVSDAKGDVMVIGHLP